MHSRTPWLVVRSLLIAYIISAVLLTALSFVFFKLRLPEAQVGLAVNVVYIVSCLIGGFVSGKAMKSRRFFWGLLTGLLYFAVLFLMSYVQDAGLSDDTGRILTVLAMCVFSGMAGGMLS